MRARPGAGNLSFCSEELGLTIKHFIRQSVRPGTKLRIRSTITERVIPDDTTHIEND